MKDYRSVLCYHIVLLILYELIIIEHYTPLTDPVESGLSNLTLTPITIGVEAHGVSIHNNFTFEDIETLRKLLRKHAIILFRNQGRVSAENHLKIARWFGNELDGEHRKHPKQENKYVFRVSNDKEEGFVGVGHQGYHIDGFFLEKPHEFVLYTMPNVSTKGSTVFVNLYEVVENLEPERRQLWNKIWFQSRIRTNIFHPLIYTHPYTERETICINTHFIEKVLIRENSQAKKVFESGIQVKQMVSDLEYEFNKKDHHMYTHKWREGDFLITDNLALAHIADPDTQLPREQIGLRVLHRVSVVGRQTPTQMFTFNSSSTSRGVS